MGAVVTKATPGDNRSWVSCGNTLQDGGLVNIDGEVLGSGQDDRFSIDARGCGWIRSRGCGHQRGLLSGVSLILPVIDSWASWLYRVLAMFEATQRNKPPSVCWTPLICRTPLGSSVYLPDTEVSLVGQNSLMIDAMCRVCLTPTWSQLSPVGVGLSAR